MSKIVCEREDIVAIADAVRSKGNTTEAMTLGEIENAVYNIKSAIPTQEKTIDITANGTVEIISDEGYVMSKVTANVDVGVEEWINDGNTHIWINLQEGRTSPMLCVCPKGTVTVDWGDGTTPDVLTGTSATIAQYTPTHNYASAGDYVITLTVDGNMGFISSSGYTGLLIHPDMDVRSTGYRYGIRKVEIGTGVTSIGSNAFSSYYGLTNIMIPDSVTSIKGYAFANSCGLTNIVIPDGIPSIGDQCFSNCYRLTNIVIPDSVTSIGNSSFKSCYNLTNIAIPNSITSIGPSAFNYCYRLTNIVIPDSVTSIGSDAFNSCYGLSKIRFERATPPSAGGSNTFKLPKDCIISVPVGSLEAYTTATNYPSASTYTYVEE